jgi:para-aminobenzoate synthetase/4-amino-4-deoxychorismate lyase
MLERIVLRSGPARWLEFSGPVEVLVARRAADVIPVLEHAERRVREDGLHAAGYVSYEAAPGFDGACVTRAPGRLPLACFGIFREPRPVSVSRAAALAPPGRWRMSVERDEYVAKIAAIKEQIAAGNTYQVNYTVRQLGTGITDPWQLFLATAIDAPYAAYVECADHVIVSASPELFFERDGEALVCRPMKGTVPRGLTPEQDRALGERLRASPKDRAENVMIADMVRNDLGRVAEPGSVRATALCELEKYRTVWQLTSTVRARSRASLAEVFRALFPCASVTGAPKISTMRLIAALEDSPREIYTGAIGCVAPGDRARFSVAIRTAWIERGSGTAVYGVGGGIVWDSDPLAEYQECLDKARILATGPAPGEFELLETLLWTGARSWFLLDLHLERLARSAEYFDFSFDRTRVRQALAALAAGLPAAPRRVRLRLARDGSVLLEATALAERGTRTRRVRLARNPVDRRDPFLYHKTTARSVYERALAEAGDCDDVLLWNAEGEVTESAVANVVVRLGGRLVTPPVECGLLAGTLRTSLLAEGRVRERRIRIEELGDAEELWLVNSVRGWMRAELIDSPSP